MRQKHHISNLTADPREGTVASQVSASLHFYPSTLLALSSLLHIRLHKIDMGSLLKAPQELFISEEEWAGRKNKEKKKQKLPKVKEEDVIALPISASGSSVITNSTTPATSNEPIAMEVEEPAQTWAGIDSDFSQRTVNGNGRLSDYEPEGWEELNEVLEYVANVIVELDKKIRAKKGNDGIKGLAYDGSNTDETDKKEGAGSTKEESMTEEDPTLRNLRLNLLALAKRAPLDTIARLPKDLVPAHIRHVIPTLGLSSKD